MRRRPSRAVVSAVFALGLIGAAYVPAGAIQPQRRSALVTVLANAEAPITDLTAKDFVVYDDDVKREVVAADRARDPLSIVLLVDTSQPPMGSMPSVQEVRAALAAFVKTVRTDDPEADIALGEVAGAAVMTVDFGKPADLDASIARLYPDQPSGAVLLEALSDAAAKLLARPAPRRAIVSVDFNSWETSGVRALKPAVASIHAAGATLWAVSVRGTELSVPTREEVLETMTKANGGMRLTVQDASALGTTLKMVANTLASQYIVTFMRPGGNPKTTRIETTRGAKVLLSPFMR
jgi:hypothetical protein